MWLYQLLKAQDTAKDSTALKLPSTLVHAPSPDSGTAADGDTETTTVADDGYDHTGTSCADDAEFVYESSLSTHTVTLEAIPGTVVTEKVTGS